MKWTLVVYFITAGVRQFAEVLGKDKIGWSSVIYGSYQQCSSREGSNQSSLRKS